MTALGHELGALGYTTLDEARALVDHLALAPGDRLLDIGSGPGWPGIEIALATGARLIATDVPRNALVQARRAFESGGLQDSAVTAVVDGRAIPLREGSVHGVTHADVLC